MGVGGGHNAGTATARTRRGAINQRGEGGFRGFISSGLAIGQISSDGSEGGALGLQGRHRGRKGAAEAHVTSPLSGVCFV